MYRSLFVCLLLTVSGNSDEHSSCDLESRRSARLLEQIPCDMKVQSFCKEKGSVYPEIGIHRFKDENRALMKRMYGDMESMTIIREMRGESLVEPSILYSSQYNIRIGSGPLPKTTRKKILKKKMSRKPLVTNKPSLSSLALSLIPDNNSFSYNEDTTTTVPLSETPEETASTISDTTYTLQNDENENDENVEREDEEIFPMLTSVSPTTLIELTLEPESKSHSTVSTPPSTFSYTEEEEEEEEKEEEETLMNFSGPSINACPVKEEVLAPYWANNTRDQVLALLNLYPFEQYIHMETCQYENEQMYCRSGCRCEQQFRLHRLLAFDPNNECRGIFSDWFRFPSYCVCKCYNIVEELVGRPPRKPRKEIKSKEEKKKTTKELYNKLDIEEREDYLSSMSQKESFIPNPHFFYGSPSPILEFQLSDGSRGSIHKKPRK